MADPTPEKQYPYSLNLREVNVVYDALVNTIKALSMMLKGDCPNRTATKAMRDEVTVLARKMVQPVISDVGNGQAPDDAQG